jgi:hypothetical protein
MEQVYTARGGRGFPRGFITQLRKFHRATCAVSKRTRRYRRSKRVKVADAKRARREHAIAEAGLNYSKTAEHAGEPEAQKPGSTRCGIWPATNTCGAHAFLSQPSISLQRLNGLSELSQAQVDR